MSPLAQRLIDAHKANLRVLRDLHGVQLTEEQVEERARNFVCALLLNFEVKELP